MKRWNVPTKVKSPTRNFSPCSCGLNGTPSKNRHWNGVSKTPRSLRAGPWKPFPSRNNLASAGVGKTGLASSLLLKAIQNGYRGRFIRAQDLFDEMYASLADRSTRKLLNHLIKIDLLVIDEMGYLNLRPEQTNIFFKLMEERYNRRATLITTNLDYDEWHQFLGNRSMVDALLSRVRHHCQTIRIEGPSLREPQG